MMTGLFSGPSTGAELFDCVLMPSLQVEIGSPVSGVLGEVMASRGARVSAGQVLARLENSVQMAVVDLHRLRVRDRTAVAAQQARLALAQARMERAVALLERGATTEQVFDEAEAELEVSRAELARLETALRFAEAELRQAEAALALRDLASPVEAVVVDRLLGPGEFVGQDDAVLRLAQLDPLHIEAFLPTGYFARLHEGLEGEVVLEQPVATTYAASVTVIDRVFDPTSDTLRVRLELPNPDWAIPAGQRCQLRLALPGDGPG